MTATHVVETEIIVSDSGMNDINDYLPDDWPVGERVTVVLGVAPEGLTPAGDGIYYGPLSAVPEDWSWTDHTEATAQVKAYNARGMEAGRIVMAWPGPQPDTAPCQSLRFQHGGEAHRCGLPEDADAHDPLGPPDAHPYDPRVPAEDDQ